MSERAILFRWASETGSHGMPRPEELEREGYRFGHRHPWWSNSILMRKALETDPMPIPLEEDPRKP